MARKARVEFPAKRARFARAPPNIRAERAAKITDSEKKIVVRNEANMRRGAAQ